MLYSDLTPAAQKKALANVRASDYYLSTVNAWLREDVRKALMADGYSNLPIHISFPHTIIQKKASIDVCVTLKSRSLLDVEQVLSFSNAEDLPLSYPEKITLTGVYTINGCDVRAVGDIGESESMLRQVERSVREWLIDVSKSVHSVSLECFALYCDDDAVRDHIVDMELSFDSKGVFVGESKKKK